MKRRKLLLGNWKMNKLRVEARDFVSHLPPLVEKAQKYHIDIGVAPSYLSLSDVIDHAPQGLIVAAQNCHYQPSGAYTGEVAIGMLQEIGVTWSLVGHSERRTYDNESDEKCNLKIKALLEHHFTPVYCVGETLEQYEKGMSKDIVREQVVIGLKDVHPHQVKNIVIAYEPVWSIGTGKNASCEIAQDMCAFIRSLLHDLFGMVSEEVRILYGGSVNPSNIKDYLLLDDVDGALIGGASLKMDSFAELLDNVI